MKLPFTVLMIGASLLLLRSVEAQGPLQPPTAPTPTMKTLDQVEARIPIDAAHTPGDANNDFIINQRGSYYLTGNLTVLKPTGIQVNIPNVTIDLNGFEITRTSGSGNCFGLTPSSARVTIRNGVITGFVQAVVGTGTNVLCEHLKVIGTGNRSFDLGNDAVVKNCEIQDGGLRLTSGSILRDTIVNSALDVNVTLFGVGSQVVGLTFATSHGQLFVGQSALLADSQITAAGTPPDIFGASVVATGNASVIRNCTISAGNVAGSALQVGDGTLVTGCRILQAFQDGIGINTAANVTVESCSVQGHGFRGIVLGPRARVRDCTIQGGGSDGIVVGENSIVSDSTVAGGQGNGITAIFDSCTIKRCTAAENDGDGIKAASHTTIEDCTARSNQGNGIVVVDASLISNCVANLNGRKTTPNNTAADGIEIGARNRVLNCTLFNNAQHGVFSGAANNRNYIEDCLIHSNTGFAIFLQGNGNTVIKNQVAGNTGGMINQASGGIAPLNFASDPVGTVHPLANFK